MTIKAGIIGFGKMGALHAKGYCSANTEIVGIMDEHAPENTYKIFSSMDEFLQAVDVVSICTPSKTHKAIALRCISMGKPILVEKPLAMNVSECEEIIALARQENVKVSVGHIERYNSGFKALCDNLHMIGNIQSVEAVRTNPSSNRIVDADVLSDLSVHDLDLIRTVCAGGTTLENIVIKDKKINSQLNLIDSVDVSFELNNISVNLRTCRVADSAQRCLSVVGDKGTLFADLASRKATLNGVEIAVEPLDQIDAQLQAWVSSVESKTDPVVSMQDGLFAVSASDAIRNAC